MPTPLFNPIKKKNWQKLWRLDYFNFCLEVPCSVAIAVNPQFIFKYVYKMTHKMKNSLLFHFHKSSGWGQTLLRQNQLLKAETTGSHILFIWSLFISFPSFMHLAFQILQGYNIQVFYRKKAKILEIDKLCLNSASITYLAMWSQASWVNFFRFFPNL